MEHKKNIKRRNYKKHRGGPQGYTLGNPRRWINVENASTTFLDPMKYISLKYSETFAQSTTNALGSALIFKINSLYDPNGSLGGHQPYGFDQLSALYGRYRVLRCKYKLTFGTSTGTIHVLAVPTSGALANAIASDTTFWTASEMPRAKHNIIGGGGAPAIHINGSVSLPSLFGSTISEYKADDRYSAAVNNDPTAICYLNLGFLNPTVSTVITQTQVELEFLAELYQPIAQGGSTFVLTDVEKQMVLKYRKTKLGQCQVPLK